jgi:hypothetical protein
VDDFGCVSEILDELLQISDEYTNFFLVKTTIVALLMNVAILKALSKTNVFSTTTCDNLLL